MLLRMIDKSIIIAMCMLMVVAFDSNTQFVAASVTAVLIALLISLDKLKPIVYQLIIIAYIFSIVIFPEFIAFLPVMVYEIADRRMKAAFPAAVLIYIYSIETCGEISGSGIIPVWFSLMYTGVCSAASVLLQYRTRKYLDTDARLRIIRDDAIENSLLLKSKNAQLLEKQDYEIRVATLQERNRIAREIHDNVGHMLTRALLQTGAVKAVAKDDVLKPQLDSLHDTLNTAMTNIRTSVHDLHDESVDLKSAVSEVVMRFPAFETSLEYEVSSDVPRNIKYCFIAIVKEAMNNAAKHSNGDKMVIIIREQPGFYQLVIEDNGTDIPSDFTGGMGISSMESRVKAVNGNFNITTSKGFRINISVMK